MALSIGPSTGWLYANGLTHLGQQQLFLDDSGANAVEFCLGQSLKKTDNRVASLLDSHITTNQEYRSLHIPDFNPNEDASAQSFMAKKIAIKRAAYTIVIHPLKVNGEYPIEYYQMLSDAKGAQIHIAVENMDKTKQSGVLVEDLEKLTQRHGLYFVLDVQHAYEQDFSMSYARDLFNTTRDRLVHFHVSGEVGNCQHCLLHRARNVKPIVEFLGWAFDLLNGQNCPIVLEGEYRIANDINKEIDFIQRAVGF